jgi:ubiquinone/menaquinone biosynthesis C-methylase UbiE
VTDTETTRLHDLLVRERGRLISLLEAAGRSLERARLRLESAGESSSNVGDHQGPAAERIGYGDRWGSVEEAAAMETIFNTDDSVEFERSGQETAESLATMFEPTATVMDVGCGIGRVARYIAPRCAKVWAVDASPLMLTMARNRLSKFPNIEYAQCFGTAIPSILDGSVDMAYSLLVLQHLEREDAFLLLREIRRILRPGGTALFTFPNLLSEEYLEGFITYAETGEVSNPVRARIYTPQEADRILTAAGFDVLERSDDVEIGRRCQVAA